jgi:glycosyltransferase involved in cell wall biosynthesis
MFGNGEDIGPVRKSIGDDVPCVLRIDHRAMSLMSRTSQKNARLDLASSILCDSLRTRNELVHRQIALPPDVQIVSDGVTLPHQSHERTLVRQANSRALLGDAHPILRIEPAQPLVVTGAPMNGDGGICDLIRAWQVVLESFPKGKLWILGDGPRARKVWDTISDHDMVYSAIMTGYFDDVSEIFQAADLYVHPMRNAVNCQSLFSAIAHQVCPLAATSSHEPIHVRDRNGNKVGNTIKVQKDQTGIIAPAGNSIALGEAITMALRNSDTRRQLGEAAGEQFSPAIDIERIGKVFCNALFGVQQTQNASGASSF